MHKRTSFGLLFLYLIGTAVFSVALALLFPLTNYEVSSLSLPWLSEDAGNAYWLLDNHTDADYFSSTVDTTPYRDMLLSMENDQRFSYLICNVQSIYPDNVFLGDRLRGVVINQAANDIFSVAAAEGRSFAAADFLIDEQSEIPVLIGSDLANMLSVGDAFQASYFGQSCSFRVIGILSHDTMLYRLDTPIQTEDCVLIPAFFPAEDRHPVFEKALLQFSFDAIVFAPALSFSDLYRLLWEKAVLYQIDMVGFGRVAPLLQSFLSYRHQLGTLLSCLLPLIYLCLRLLIYTINLPHTVKHRFLCIMLLFVTDVTVYSLLFPLIFASEYSFAIPWQYYGLECTLCLLVCLWGKKYGQKA